ncbi:unnamed protein product [Brassicogethes aeneus]|uniref:Uncharacterized protein n=1 Tax=Brassicogethes aeneus TaxID=1431903 RepID=A0A9P0FED6_BRAAE|nr:unnamed protein product [Brassicogethes aeneus]
MEQTVIKKELEEVVDDSESNISMNYDKPSTPANHEMPSTFGIAIIQEIKEEFDDNSMLYHKSGMKEESKMLTDKEDDFDEAEQDILKFEAEDEVLDDKGGKLIKMTKPRNKLTNEEKLEAKRQAERERRRRIRDDPVKQKEQSRKNHQKYIKQKEKKIVKSISELSPREKRMQRKKWKKNSKEYRERKKQVHRYEDKIAVRSQMDRSNRHAHLTRRINANKTKRHLKKKLAA